MKLIDNILYIEYADFVEAGWKEDAIKKANFRNGPYWQMLADPTDKRKVLVQFETMRQKDKEKLIAHFGNPYQHLASFPLMKMLPDVPEAARTFYNDYEYNGNTKLPDTHINQCMRYVQWLLLVDRFISDKAIKKEIRTELGLSMDEFAKTLQTMVCKDKETERISGKHGASWTKLTLNVKILNHLKENASGRSGYAAFIDSNFGNDNRKIVTDEVVELLNNLFRKQAHKPTPKEVANQYRAFIRGEMDMIIDSTGELLQPADYPELSEGTILHWLRKWENKAPAVAARTGNRQLFINEQVPSHKKIAPLWAGSKLSIDDRQPPFEYGPSKRAWFYMGIDLCSGAWTCWVHGKTKEELLQNFYRQMLRNYAEWGLCLPHELECEMSLNSQYQNTLLADGAMFGKVQMEANNARGKRIERYFRDMRYEVEKTDTGWIPRPFARSESNRAGVKNNDYDKPAQFVPYETIIEKSIGHIVDWNNSEHPKHPGMSRWEVFMTMQNPNLTNINYRAILPHVGYTTRSSVKAGQLLLQGTEWLLGNNNEVVAGGELINYLKAVNGRDVLVQWIDGNDGKVLQALVCTTDGRYICQAVAKPAYNTASIEQTDKDRHAKSILSKYVATVTGFINTEKGISETVTVIDNTPKFKPAVTFNVPGMRRPIVTETIAENLGDAYEEIELPNEHTTAPSWRDKFLKH